MMGPDGDLTAKGPYRMSTTPTAPTASDLADRAQYANSGVGQFFVKDSGEASDLANRARYEKAQEEQIIDHKGAYRAWLSAFTVKDSGERQEYANSGVGQFFVKDSGKRQEFASGMVRDVEEGKIDYSLVLDGPMFKRCAIHLTKGAQKYEARNWMKAAGQEELDRFRSSALRHFLQWYWGEDDEDHAAAVSFNINGAEYVKERLSSYAGD